MSLRRRVGLVAAVTVLAAATACTEPGRGEGRVPSPADSGHTTHPSASGPPAQPLRAGERFAELSMQRPYAPAPPHGGTDDYRCFLVDPGLSTATFVTGSQFLPDNVALVHHAIFFRVEPGDVAEARQLDAEAAGDGWTCFGGSGIGARRGVVSRLRSTGDWIAAWAPGGGENLLDPRTGYLLEPGTQLVMQVHYNLLATGGKPPGTDLSGLRLRLRDGSADLRRLQVSLLPAPVELACGPGESGPLCDRDAAVQDVTRRFGVPAGAIAAGLNLLCNAGREPVAGPVRQCDHKVGRAGTVYAVAGHMHKLGRSITVELNPGTPRARMLLNVPTYDFDDQSARPLPTPVAVAAGDTYRVTCTHDAGLRKLLPELRDTPPRYVVWGDGTTDEMCLGIVVWSPTG